MINFEKYIIVKNLKESELRNAAQKLANLYADSGVTKEIKVFKSKTIWDEHILNFPESINFNYLKYFVNYLHYSGENHQDIKYQVYGYWTITEKEELTPQLNGVRIQLYVSPNDKDGVNVYGIPQNGAQTIQLGFAIGYEFKPLGTLEFDFFEKEKSQSNFQKIKSIYGVQNKSLLQKIVPSRVLLSLIILSIVASYIYYLRYFNHTLP